MRTRPVTKIKGLEHYTDKYFLRSKEILRKEGLNPLVRAQVFVRKGPGVVAGLDEALRLIQENSTFEAHGGIVYALQDGDIYSPKETQMVLEGPIQDIIDLETTYLGVIARGVSKENDNTKLNYERIEQNAREIVQLVGDRPVTYFGARHWHYEDDAKIAAAALRGGFVATSTDAGSKNIGKKGVGTIPHALENIYAYVAGKENAVKEATLAFDRHMDLAIPRVALVDYNNKEIDDSIATIEALNEVAVVKGEKRHKLKAVRVDTPGENVAQGAWPELKEYHIKKYGGIPQEYQKYWAGTGVTISGVYNLRRELDKKGYSDVEIMLTSGFGDKKKVEAFVDAEKRLGVKLFDSLGVGGVYKSRAATMDIVAVGDSRASMQSLSKVGRSYQPNDRLKIKTNPKCPWISKVA